MLFNGHMILLLERDVKDRKGGLLHRERCYCYKGNSYYHEYGFTTKRKILLNEEIYDIFVTIGRICYF